VLRSRIRNVVQWPRPRLPGPTADPGAVRRDGGRSQDAPERVRELHQEILTIVESVLPLTEDALSLVAAYAGRKILPTKYEADMRHIALATLDRVDALVAGTSSTSSASRRFASSTK
jgi:hypothetical protein